MRNNNFVRIPSFAAVPLVVAYVAVYMASIETIEVVVEDKSAGRHHQAMEQSPLGPALSPGVSFLVYSADEVFKVDKDYLFFEFASAERYNSMKVGQRHTVTVTGWRIPALHWYRNIVRVSE